MTSTLKTESLWAFYTSFSTEEDCRKHLEKVRWNGNITCVHCNHNKVYTLKSKWYECSKCKKQFSLLHGTIFYNSNIPLRKWFLAIQLCVNQKKGISSHQLGRSLEIAQPNALYALRRIRKAMKNSPEFKQQMETVVEVDESYFGGKAHFKHRRKRKKGTQGRSTKDKCCAFGILERDGNVKVYHLQRMKRNGMQGIIRSKVKEGAVIASDEFSIYQGLNRQYEHGVVFHAGGQYVNGMYHTNSIEGFWSLFKRTIYGVYHSHGRKHFQSYCNEAEYRYNTRKMTDGERFENVLSHCVLAA